MVSQLIQNSNLTKPVLQPSYPTATRAARSKPEDLKLTSLKGYSKLQRVPAKKNQVKTIEYKKYV